jgi:hypothetical protein
MVQVVGALARCPPAPVALSIAVVIFQCSPGAQPARGGKVERVDELQERRILRVVDARLECRVAQKLALARVNSAMLGRRPP